MPPGRPSRRLPGLAWLICLVAAGGCVMPLQAQTQQKTVGDETVTVEPLFIDEFETLDHWVNLNPGGTEWKVEDGQLIGHWASGGSTIWCDQFFEGDVLVEFTGRLLTPKDEWVAEDMPEGGKNFNFHFKARGPEGTEDILDAYLPLLREGKGPNKAGFIKYRGYFLTWTLRHARLRRNPGYSAVAEQTDYLPQIGQTYHFKLLQRDGRLRYWINDRLIFDYHDPEPWEQGRMGFTLWRSSVAIDRFAVYRVK